MNVSNELIDMASKTVVLREEAYEFLRKQKRPGDTFSDVVLRLRGATKPLTSFAGAWKEMPDAHFEEVKEIMRKGRELERKKMDRLLERSGAK
jgi:predicted CopG family antitoxin